MSKKHQGRKYNLANVKEEIKYNYITGAITKVINPFANGNKTISALDWVAKNQSEKYRRIKK